ncbi:MAG TPA: site-2 protease family protein [Oscillatoriaceae cyanobacterium]
MNASFTGILVTIILLGLLIVIHEGGHFLAAKSLRIPVRQFAIGFGPKVFGVRWGETEVRLNWIPLGGYCAFVDDEEEGQQADVDPSRLLRSRPVIQRMWVVSAGVIFNFVSAWLILWFSMMALGVPTGHQLLYAQKVLPGTPAAAAGLKSGDEVIAVQNQTFKDFAGFKDLMDKYKGKPIVVTLDRAGKSVAMPITSKADGTLGFMPMIREQKQPAGNPVQAAGAAAVRQGTITSQLWHALSGFVTQPRTMIKETGGPISIVAFGDQIFQVDPFKLIDFAVLLSIELAIINILPLPALDGGHLAMLIIESFRGKPLPRRVEEGILMAGFVLIMGLGALLILKDLLTVPGMYHH